MLVLIVKHIYQKTNIANSIGYVSFNSKAYLSEN